MSLFPKFKIGLGPAATSATPTPQSSKSSESSRPPKGEIGYCTLYHQAAEAIAEDCYLIDPAWLLDHSAFYERIKALDDRLTVMERTEGSEHEYSATLARLVTSVQDARAAYEREREQAGEKAAVQ